MHFGPKRISFWAKMVYVLIKIVKAMTNYF